MSDSLLFDHIAIGAASLDEGVRELKRVLDVEVPFGGTHPRMGTHNCLTRLSDTSFLEIITVDFNAPPPNRPRLFDLDDADQQGSLLAKPKPIAWIARARNIGDALSRARSAGLDLGRPMEMTRGDLRWRIAVRDDGHLPQGGVLPVIIQWPDGPHPAQQMKDLGLRMRALRLFHPEPEMLRAKLGCIGAAELATIERCDKSAPHIECTIETSDGRLCAL